jgi:hypothetical protein
MRRLLALLVVLAACNEPLAVRAPPTDRFVFPTALAVTAHGTGSALLVASSNLDLLYDGATGGTVLSVNPRLQADGGSAGTNGVLVKLPADGGARIGSYAGQLVVADPGTCPGTAAGQTTALVASRYSRELYALPLVDGALSACTGPTCTVGLSPALHDPYAVTLACRADGSRRSVFVSFLETADLDGYGSGISWLEEHDLDRLNDPLDLPRRTLSVGTGPVIDVAYDAQADRLFALSRPQTLSAPIQIVDLPACEVDPTPPLGTPATGACQAAIFSVDLFSQLRGVDPQAIALSTPQPGLGRRAYVAARIYDPELAVLIGARPPGDLAGALLVLDLEPDLTGQPSLTILRSVTVGLGASQVRVLPACPSPGTCPAPRRDVVVLTSSQSGELTVYDDETEQVVRVIALDQGTGIPQAGRAPFALAVEPSFTAPVDPLDPVARVYVAAFQQSVVSLLDVHILTPGQADLVRDASSGAPVRIGGLQ